MNIKTNLDSIKSILSAFSLTRAMSGKIVPHSYDSFNCKESNRATLMEKINSVTPYGEFIPKKKRLLTGQIQSFSGVLYGNNKLERLTEGTTTDSNKIILGYVNKENEYRDMRVQGGGIKKQYAESLSATNPFIGSYLDIGHYDGIPTQIQTSIVVELPESFRLKKEEIMRAINKYIAAGVFPVLRFYKEVT